MRASGLVFAAISLLLLANPAAANGGKHKHHHPPKNLVVHPGESIQAAVDAASSGDTIVVLPGTYHEAGVPCPTDASHTCAVVVTIVTSCVAARCSAMRRQWPSEPPAMSAP